MPSQNYRKHSNGFVNRKFVTIRDGFCVPTQSAAKILRSLNPSLIRCKSKFAIDLTVAEIDFSSSGLQNFSGDQKPISSRITSLQIYHAPHFYDSTTNAITSSPMEDLNNLGSMIVMLWNARGVCGKDFLIDFLDISRQYKLDLVILTETKFQNESASTVIPKFGYKNCLYSAVEGLYEGILLLWNEYIDIEFIGKTRPRDSCPD